MLLPAQAHALVDLYVALRKEAFEQVSPSVHEYFERCRAKVASVGESRIPHAVAVHLGTP